LRQFRLKSRQACRKKQKRIDPWREQREAYALALMSGTMHHSLVPKQTYLLPNLATNGSTFDGRYQLRQLFRCKFYFIYGQLFIFHESSNITHYPVGD